MKAHRDKIIEAETLIINARALVHLAADGSFILSEDLGGKNADIAASIGRATEIANGLLGDALEIVDAFRCKPLGDEIG
ncbi:hypothetical protein [Neorhizobium sp. DAR64860/K0K1]|uniref:hypothetical protein n=1 Tax=Neorhizobium sp. DAR64860/K0K1 TaxID=3421955 RepID=UPI003D2C5D1D